MIWMIICLKDEEQEKESGVVPGWLNYIRLWTKMSISGSISYEFHRPLFSLWWSVFWKGGMDVQKMGGKRD
jgi:hypothetical protein